MAVKLDEEVVGKRRVRVIDLQDGNFVIERSARNNALEVPVFDQSQIIEDGNFDRKTDDNLVKVACARIIKRRPV